MSASIVAPSVHLNGTSREELYHGYETAYHSILSAKENMSRIEFNARDYYVQGAKAWEIASDHRIEQFAALSRIEEYLLQHLLALSK